MRLLRDCPTLLLRHGNQGFISEVSCCIIISRAHPLPSALWLTRFCLPSVQTPLSQTCPASWKENISYLAPAQIIYRSDLFATHTYTNIHTCRHTNTAYRAGTVLGYFHIHKHAFYTYIIITVPFQTCNSIFK